MIDWKNPKRILPFVGIKVAALTCHKLEFLPESLEIIFGEVEYANDLSSCRVQTNDATGKGLFAVYLTQAPDHCEQAVAWAYVEDFSFPMLWLS